MRAIPIDDYLERADGRRAPSRYDWASLVAEGRAARADADGCCWRIGRLALTVERRYRSGALRRFAEEIGESLGSVRRYRWVADAYDERARLRFPELSFSHFQAVASLPDGLAWLERASRGGWSVDRLVAESRRPSRTGSSDAFRRPIEVATRAVARLAERVEEGPITRANREALARAVDGLAEEVERLRARLRSEARRFRPYPAGGAPGNGHRNGNGHRALARRVR